MKTTKYTLDPKNPPKLSKAEKARFDAMKDDEIDYSEVPELGDDFFERAVRTKQSLTVRFDADMLEWFKSQGKGYQTRMNAVLRAFYEQNRPN